MKELDNIEQFLKDNKAAFDTAVPSDALWSAIESKLSAKTGIEDFIKTNRDAFDTEVPEFHLWEKIENNLVQDDKIEKYISKNRDSFDTEIPSLKVWNTIEKQINRVQEYKIVKITWWRQAVAAVGLLLVGACLGIYFNQKTSEKAVENLAQQVAPDLNEAEKFYNQKVETQLTKLVSYNPDPSVMADLKQLDEIQEELKNELRNAPASTREEIVRRLIENYQTKLGILERVLYHIEEHQTGNQKIQQKNESI